MAADARRTQIWDQSLMTRLAYQVLKYIHIFSWTIFPGYPRL